MVEDFERSKHVSSFQFHVIINKLLEVKGKVVPVLN
jgi:hypothetical protein